MNFPACIYCHKGYGSYAYCPDCWNMFRDDYAIVQKQRDALMAAANELFAQHGEPGSKPCQCTACRLFRRVMFEMWGLSDFAACEEEQT